MFGSRRICHCPVTTKKDGHASRRLYDCIDCIDAWDNVCDEGVPSVCELVGYGSPITAVGQAAISTVCETLGAACSGSGGEEACAGQCEDDDGGIGTKTAPAPAQSSVRLTNLVGGVASAGT